MNAHRHNRSAALAGAAICLTGLLLLGDRVGGQNLPFSSGSTGVDGPLTIPVAARGRHDSVLAYDVARQRVVLFGGYSNGVLADTWEWDGTTWSQRAPATSPSGRYEHALAYDSVRQRVVLFGGVNSVGNLLADTWEWDGATWSQKLPGSSPPARFNHALAYDATRQRVVLFGGEPISSDTWEWDGATWTQRTPATSPPARFNHALAYDAIRQRVVSFGGYNGTYLADTWEWDGTTWSQRTTAASPSGRDSHALSYDANRQRVVLFGGYNGDHLGDTWEWDGTTWSQRAPANPPPARARAALAYDAARQRLMLFGGSNANLLDDTWEWDGTIWRFKAGSAYPFDMTGRATGVWNFTSITVPSGITVIFRKNSANTPVTWLATENVQIDGTVDVSGGNATGTNIPEQVGKGGPGGFDGGYGGTRFDVSGSYAGQPGQGPGGGLSGTASGEWGQYGEYRTLYGNAYLQPPIGGSGGGGGASTSFGNGGSGGGGGGAILIATSKDIVVNGSIKAEGGAPSGGQTAGGGGSGGAVRLVADRVTGTGSVRVADSGRIRIEGFFRAFANNGHTVAPSAGAPTETFAAAASGQLIISNIAGQNVVQPPSGSVTTPDVVFSQAGPITVTVTATNVPDGTPVRLRITTSGNVITLPAAGGPDVTLSGGTATFNATVPAGVGTVQATADYTVN